MSEHQEAAVAEFIAEVPDIDGFVFWRFQCPVCEAVFDTDYDARNTDVSCENCPWKGKAGT